jgi:hypothetical protein
MTIYGFFNMVIYANFYYIAKMLKIQKIPYLLLFVGRDHQVIYFVGPSMVRVPHLK